MKIDNISNNDIESIVAIAKKAIYQSIDASLEDKEEIFEDTKLIHLGEST